MPELLAGGRYTVMRRLAQGGMGEVLLADYPGDATIGLTKGLLVVKRVLTEHPNRGHQAAMLREEGRVALRLLHENLVETFFVDEHEGDPLLVMEFMSGRAMSQVLGQAKKRKEHVPVEVALAILRASACGLHFAHTLTDGSRAARPLGLIHRDVSPANIFVTFDGRAKVIDFGVAKADDSEIRTSTGILKGKLGYMSPEHALGEKLTPAADLWSLGVCFWETLCAERLFSMSSPSATLQAISERPIPSPLTHRPDLPRHVVELCMWLLERRVEKRLGSGASLVKAIDSLPEASTLRRIDLGGWLSGRFPEEAEQGKSEAARCARLRRRTPVPIGLVEGRAAQAPTEGETPTLVVSASVAQAARDLIDEEDAATVRLRVPVIPAGSGGAPAARDHLSSPTRDDVDAAADAADADAADDEANAPTQRVGVRPGLLADADSDPSVGPSGSALGDAVSATVKMPRAEGPDEANVGAGLGFGDDPLGPLGGPLEPMSITGTPARPITNPGLKTKTAGQSQSQTLSKTVTQPLVDRSSSWIAVAFLTFGALALAMGIAFSFLAPRPAARMVSAFEDPTGTFDILVAPDDVAAVAAATGATANAANARTIDISTTARLKSGGAVREVPPEALAEKLASSGVAVRASLPASARGRLAMLLPVTIAGLGVLSLAIAVPALLVVVRRGRLAAQVLLVLTGAAAIAFVIENGALSWPGLRAWRGDPPRLEMGR